MLITYKSQINCGMTNLSHFLKCGVSYTDGEHLSLYSLAFDFASCTRTSQSPQSSLARITHVVAGVTYDPYWGTEIFLALDAPESLYQRLWEASNVYLWLGYLRHLYFKLGTQNGESYI